LHDNGNGYAGNDATAHTLEVDPRGIPDELKRRRQWVSWRLERRNGKPTKVPYDSRTGRYAKSTDSDTWTTFEAAIDALDRSGGAYSGIGFVFSSGDPYTGIDLDHCIDGETGEIASWARGWVERLDGYAEISPSGRGLHVIVRGKAPRNGKKTIEGRTVEIYSNERFFALTGVQP
jgi:putative DNA primase/helicase